MAGLPVALPDEEVDGSTSIEHEIAAIRATLGARSPTVDVELITALTGLAGAGTGAIGSTASLQPQRSDRRDAARAARAAAGRALRATMRRRLS